MTIAGPDPPPAAVAPSQPARRALLFLFADTGGGHRASATAVAAEVAATHGDDFRVELVDPFAELSPRALAAIVGLYAPLVRHAPWAWGALWHATDNRLAVRTLRAAGTRLVGPGLRTAMDCLQPAAVVSFHPLVNHTAARLLRERGTPAIPLITVVTDLVDIHATWTCADASAVITASAGGLDHCRRAGIPADRCLDLGLPVGHAFTRAPAHGSERDRLRQRLGLERDAFTVLLCGGGEGTGGLSRRLRALLGSRLPLQLVVVCGRNERLRDELRALRATAPARLLIEGFVSNMAEWMAAADVAVTKAGPGTIAEAACTGTPLLLTSYVPGQERGNVDHVTAVGAGRYVPRPADLVGTIAELSSRGSPALAAMRRALATAARPQAAACTAELVCTLASRYLA